MATKNICYLFINCTGNLFCVHRTRAGLTALAFDILSFPALVNENFEIISRTSGQDLYLGKENVSDGILSKAKEIRSKFPEKYNTQVTPEKLYHAKKLKKVLEVIASAEGGAKELIRKDKANKKANPVIDSSLFVSFYVNVKPFCEPWPSCVARI